MRSLTFLDISCLSYCGLDPLERTATVLQPGQNGAEQRRIIATRRTPGTAYLCAILRHARTQQELANRPLMAEVTSSSLFGSTLRNCLDKRRTPCIGKGRSCLLALTTPTVTPTRLSEDAYGKIVMWPIGRTCRLGDLKVARSGLRRRSLTRGRSQRVKPLRGSVTAFLETTDPPFCGTSNVWRLVADKDAELISRKATPFLLQIAVIVE
jgi:hypothetical protein